MNKSIIKKLRNNLLSLIHGGFFLILIGNILNKAITLLSAVIVAKIVNKQEFALLAYADNLYGYLGYAMGLGLSSALLKHCSVKNERSLDKAFLTYSIKIGSVFEILMSLGMCIAVTYIAIPFPGARKYCWILLFFSTINNFYTNCICYIRTQLDNKHYALSGLLNSFISCVLTIILAKFVGTEGIVYARYIAIIIALLYIFPYVKTSIGKVEKKRLGKVEKKAFVSMGITLMFANLFGSIMPLNEAFLVNNIIKDEIVTSNFKVAGQFPQLLFLVTGAVTVYYFPIIAQMSNGREIRKKVYKIEMLNFLIICFLSAVGIAFTPLVFRLLYGSKYDDAIDISGILWIMRAINCGLRMVPINMLPAIGKTKFNVLVAAFSCILQVILDYIFLKNIGITGVAYGASIVYALSAIAYWIYFDKSCKNI